MAEKLELVGKILLDSKDAQQSIGSIKNSLQGARDVQAKVVAEFGALSVEAQEAGQNVKLFEDKLKFAINPIAAINDELEITKQKLQQVTAEFGEASPEAEKLRNDVANLEAGISALQDPVKFFNDELKSAEVELKNTIQKFGELSPEAIEAAADVEIIKDKLTEVGAVQIDEPIKNVKQQLKEANVELTNAVQKFGLGSEEAAKAAQKVAELKDTIGDAKTLTEAFNPDAKFKGLGNAIQGATGAFTALQGAQAIFGSESEDVAKTLAKVQGALALSQGVNSVLDAKDSFTALGSSAKKALAGIKAGIGATGIGVLLLALGAIVAYWDDIKGLVSGVSSEQEKLNELGTKNLEAQQEKLSALDGQEQQLKAQGKSEREILTLKLAQTDAAIQAAEVNLENQKATKKAQVEAAERNRDILKGLLNFVSLPITVLLGGVDLLTEKLNGIGLISDETFKKVGNLRDKFTGGIAELVFDPKETAEEGDKVIKEAEKSLNGLKEKRAGFNNQIASIDKAAADKAIADGKKNAEDRKKLQDDINNDALERRKRAGELQNETDKLILQNRLDGIKNQQDKERLQLEIGYQGQIDALLKSKDEESARLKDSLNKKLITQEQYDKEILNLQNANNKQREQLDIKYQTDSNALTSKFLEEKKQIESETEDIIFESKIAQLEDGLQKEQALLDNAQSKRLESQKALLDKGLIDQDEFNKRKLALEAIFQTEQNNLTDKSSLDNLQKETDKLDEIINSSQATYSAKKEALDEEERLLEEWRATNLDKDEEYTAKLKAISDKRILADVVEKETKAKLVGEIGDIATGIVKLFAGAAEKNKGLQIAAILVEQASAVAKIITNTLAANARAKLELGPVAGSGFAIKNTITAGISVAQAIKAAVDGIRKIKSANAGGSPSGGASVANQANAPLPPQAQTTQLPQEQINALTQGSESQRAYVVESDVTSSQERIVRINRAARIN